MSAGSEAVRAPRGTYDVLPAESDRRHIIEQVARRALEAAGYRRIETPVFEATEVFARGVGASTDVVQKEMYTFEDRGGRSMTLRPEGTAGVARAYLQHGMHKLPQPVKLWYLGPFFRYERVQAGRQRQLWQLGLESIGSDDPSVDAEGILVLRRILDDLGVRGLRLRLASLGSASGREGYRERLVAHLREHEDRLADEVRERIDLNPLRAFDSDHPGTRAVMATAPVLLDHLPPEDAEHFAAVRELLDAAGVAYEVDPTLVRGLDYYSRTLFEFTSDALGAQSGVGGGGRYDGLIELLGGAATPAFGWGAGIERILLASDGQGGVGAGEDGASAPRCDLYVVWTAGERGAAFALVAAATAAGHAARMDQAGRATKGQHRRASRSGARWVAVLDEGRIEMRDTSRGAEHGGSAVPVASTADALAHLTTQEETPR